MHRAVFLDRDGVINPMVYDPEFGLVDSPANPDEFRLNPRVGQSVRRIKEMGFLTIVVSNQPGVAKGRFTPSLLDAVTDKMHAELARSQARLDGVYYCLHHPHALLEEYRFTCVCRKPKPGLLLQAAQEWHIDLASSYVIGDGLTDMLAGQFVGTTNIFISSRKCYICDEVVRQDVQIEYVAQDLSDAVTLVESRESGKALDPTRYFPLKPSLPVQTRESLSALGTSR